MPEEPLTSEQRKAINDIRKLECESTKLDAEARKLNAEARDLERTAWQRPGTWVALGSGIVALVAGAITIPSGYFQRLKTIADQQGQIAQQAAAISKNAADMAKQEVDLKELQLNVLKERYEQQQRQIRDAGQRIREVNDVLAATRRRLEEAQLEMKSFELAAKAEAWITDGRADLAQQTAIKAWSAKPTPESGFALVHAFSLPIVKLNLPYSFASFMPPKGKYILAHTPNSNVQIYDTDTAQVVTTLDENNDPKIPDGWIRTAVSSPDGSRVLISKGDKTIRMWDSLKGKQLVQFEEASNQVFLAAFCSSSSVVAGIDFDLTAHTWDSVTGRVLTTTKNVGPNPAGRLLSPDCSRLATWSSSGTDADVNFEVWDMTAGKKLFDLGKAHRIVNTNFSADGDHILAAEDDGSIRVWLARNGKLLIEHNVGTGQFSQATFSPHGDLVITWSGASPEVLDLESQKKLALQGHGGIVTAAAFSFDSSLVATASEDSTVRVWSAANGKELARLKAADKVYNLEFSTDCHRLLAAGVQFVAIYRIVTADGSDFSVQ